MSFYIAVAPILLTSAYMVLKLRALTKHDKVLYSFCDVRRDVMSVLREHAFDLTKEDYIALRDIEEVASDTILDYHNFKIYIFNFRKFRAAVRRLEGIETVEH